MVKKISIFSMITLVALAGCAQMPQSSNNQVSKNHQELNALRQKQKQLSLATLAVSMNLNHVQHVISRRIQNNQPLIAAPQKEKVIKSVVVTMGNGQTSSIGTCNPESITVKAGDTLSGIATATNTTVNELEAWNGLHSGNIDTGEVLITSQCPGAH